MHDYGIVCQQLSFPCSKHYSMSGFTLSAAYTCNVRYRLSLSLYSDHATVVRTAELTKPDCHCLLQFIQGVKFVWFKANEFFFSNEVPLWDKFY